VSPTFGIVGTTVTITGSNFGTNQGGTASVSFNGTIATASSWQPGVIVVTVPAGATSGNVNVTDSGVTGAGAFFAVTGPIISSVSATSAEIGRYITLVGSYFGTSQGTSTVTFNGIPGTVDSWTNQGIGVYVPPGATTGNLLVNVNGASASAGTFTIIPTPVITSISTPQAVVGTSVTITGTNFGSSPGQLFFLCNYITTGLTWTNTAITLPVPSCSGSGTVSVMANSPVGYYTFASNSVNFAVVPNITGLSPATGTLASSIQINGTGFGYGSGATVTFNGVAANPTAWIPTQITTDPPVGSTSGNVVVNVGGISSAGSNFVLQPGPAITGLSVPSGVVTTPVTITGNGFGTATGTVTFNGTAATVGTWTATSIAVTVPSGATTGNVIVTAGGVASNGLLFTLDAAPSISQLSQTSGSVGTPIIIYGSNFLASQGTSTVKFNGTTATVSSWSAYSIAVTVPSGATTGNIVVNVLGQASAGFSFTVSATPTISSLSPTSGPVGIIVTVSGSNFGSSADTLTFNGDAATTISWASGTIKAPVPAGSMTGPVVVTVNNGPSNGSTFTVTPGPGITGIFPTTGGIGATVTITGAGFGTTPTVKFNGTAATPTSASDGSITVPVPTGATTGNVVVTAGGTASNALSFTVSSGFSITSVTPTSGNTGEAVTITGTGFGTSQGSNSLSFNGATATVTSWTNTVLKTTVPAAATSGPVVVTISNAPSDGISFTVPPQITEISPNPAASYATVTITGENFGATQGASTVTCSGGALGVSSWSSSTIVLTGCMPFLVAPNTAEVPVQVTVNGVPSTVANIAAIPIASLTAVNPYPAAVGTPVLIRGKGLGATQGQSTITIDGAAATPTSWSDTAIVVPVPSGAAASGSIIATVGGEPSYPSLPFAVAAQSAPTTLQITPAGVNMLIGGTQQFVVMDNQNQIRYDATWTVDNQTLATITTGSSPTLSAIAAGTVNLTATVGTVSTQMPVTISALTSFPTGTVLWSAPPTPGFSPSQIVEAVPTPYGPSVFSVENSSESNFTQIQAFTPDGQEMWQNEVNAIAGNVVSDVNGGTLFTEACNAPNAFPMTLAYLDPISGGLSWELPIPTQVQNGQYICLPDTPKIAVRQDDALIVTMPLQITPALVIVDGPSGAEIATPAIPASTITDEFGNSNSCDCYTPVGQPIVDSDGSAYLEYELRESQASSVGPGTVSSTLWLMKIATDNSTSAVQISSSNTANLFPGPIIPDGQGGILATWAIVPIDPDQPPIAYPYQIADVLNSQVNIYQSLAGVGPVVNGPDGLPLFSTLMLGDDGAAFISGNGGVTSFDAASGSINWSYQTPSQTAFSVISTTEADGLAAQLTDSSGNLSNIYFDNNGNTTPSSFSAFHIDPWGQGTWLGIMNNSFAEFADPQAPMPPPGWNAGPGNRHKQYSAQLPIIHTFVPFPYTFKPGSRTIVDPTGPANFVNFLSNDYTGQAEMVGFPSATATFPAFQKDLSTPLHVLGFIGHSFELGAPSTSVGICFSIKDAVYTLDCVIQDASIGLFSQAANLKVKPEDIIQFQVTPKIVFIAACKTQASFLKLWNITDNVTKGHALVISQVQPTQGEDLLNAATAYTAFLTSLLRGNTVEKAKNDANAAIPNGAPFVVLGDHSVRIIASKP
jgi:hypothetical protein